MTKKHFIALADAIKKHNAEGSPSWGQRPFDEFHLSALEDFCAAQNPLFDRDRWLSYIAGEGGANGGKSQMSATKLINTKFCFDLPFWVMEDEFTRPARVGENTDGNLIEDTLFTHRNVVSVCLDHQCWVEFETTVSAEKLPEAIESAHQFVEKTLRYFKKHRG